MFQVQKVFELLKKSSTVDHQVMGFYTEEVRNGSGNRTGFDIVLLNDGNRSAFWWTDTQKARVLSKNRKSKVFLLSLWCCSFSYLLLILEDKSDCQCRFVQISAKNYSFNDERCIENLGNWIWFVIDPLTVFLWAMSSGLFALTMSCRHLGRTVHVDRYVLILCRQ